MMPVMNLQQISQLSTKFKSCQISNVWKNIRPRLLHSSFCRSRLNVYTRPMTSYLRYQYPNLLVIRPISVYQGMGCYLRPVTHFRSFSSQNEEPTSKSESKILMNFPLIVWPSVLHTLKNWILVFLIIKPFYEQDFSLKNFSSFSRQAFIKVSEILSRGDFSALSEFVEDKALNEVKRNYSLLNFKERLDIATSLEDIFFYFPYQIGIIMTDSKNDGQAQRVFLEITMCYHIFHGFKDFLERSNENEMRRGLYDNVDRISVANYRFIREVTKGTEDQWMINVLNHFKPSKVFSR